ncbi:MAG: sulfotransferase [Bacteroidetes bacterium]|nr:sulfotransferase [Bacteroidota bacterium]
MGYTQICKLEEAFDALIFKGKQVGKTPEDLKQAGSKWTEAVWLEASRMGAKHYNDAHIADGIAFGKRAVFLCGVERSGTTLLRNLLDDHEALSVLPSEGTFISQLEPKMRLLHPSKWMEFLCREWLWRLAISDHQPPFWLLGRSTEDFSSYVDFARIFLSWWPIVERELSISITIWPQLVLQIAFEDVQQKLIPGKFKKYWVDKTPRNELYLNRLWKDLPEAKVVYITRDPEAVINSRKRMEWFTGTPVKYFIRDLQKSMKIAISERQKKRPHFLLIKYESLVSEPVATMGKLAAFLEIDYYQKLLVPTVVGNLTNSNSSFEGNDSKGEILTNTLKPPKIILTNKEMKLLQASVGSYSNLLGYKMKQQGKTESFFIRIWNRII